MAIVATLISNTVARGGKRLVFIQTDDVAVIVYGPFSELRPTAENVATFLATHGAALLDALKTAEMNNALGLVLVNGSLAVLPPFRYATANDIGAFLRAFYSTASRTDAIMVGDYLNTLTDAQLRNLFNMTQAQVNNLRTNKLGPAATEAADIRAATGA